MLTRRRQGGFTLIEIIFAVAISSALVMIAIAGQANTRQRAAFSSSIESIKNNLKKTQNEALTTVSVGGLGGTDTTKRLFAKRVIFTPGSSTAQVDTLLISEDGTSMFTAAFGSYQISFSAGVVYDGGSVQSIVFTRSPDYMYVVTGNIGATMTPGNYYRSNTAFNPSAPTGFHFSSSGLMARVMVDSQNSTITRVFEN